MDWLWIVFAVVACPAVAWLAVRRPPIQRPSTSRTPRGTQGSRATRAAAREPRRRSRQWRGHVERMPTRG